MLKDLSKNVAMLVNFLLQSIKKQKNLSQKGVASIDIRADSIEIESKKVAAICVLLVIWIDHLELSLQVKPAYLATLNHSQTILNSALFKTWQKPSTLYLISLRQNTGFQHLLAIGEDKPISSILSNNVFQELPIALNGLRFGELCAILVVMMQN